MITVPLSIVIINLRLMLSFSGWRRGEVGVDLCSYLTFEYEMMPSLSNFYGMSDVELLGRFENLEIG